MSYPVRAEGLVNSTSTRLTQARLKTFTHLSFFFVLGSYSISTLLGHVHLDFSASQSGGASPLAQHPKRPDVQFHCSLSTAHCTGLKTSFLIIFWYSRTLCLRFLLASHSRILDAHASCVYIPSRHPTHAIRVAFALSFVYLKTHLYPVLWNPLTNIASQKSIYSTTMFSPWNSIVLLRCIFH